MENLTGLWTLTLTHAGKRCRAENEISDVRN